MTKRTYGAGKPSLHDLQAAMNMYAPAGGMKSPPAFMALTPRAPRAEGVKNKHEERDAQTAVVSYLHKCCPAVVVSSGLSGELWGMARHVPKGVFYGWMNKLKARGMLTGYADLTLHWSPARSCFIEMKKPTGGTESDTQITIRTRLESYGFKTYIVRSIDDLRAVISAENIPCIEHKPQ